MSREPSHVVIYGQRERFIGTTFGQIDTIDLSQNPDYEFLPKNRYLVFDKECYDIITKHHHLGPRGENYYDITRMDYLITRSGIIFKFMYVNYERKIQWLDAPQFENLSKSKESISKKLRNFELTSGVSKKTGRPYYYMKFDVIKEPSEFVRKYLNPEYQLKQVPQLTYYKIIRTNEDIKSSLEYLRSLHCRYGLDYETNGFPFDSPDFYHMGVAIVSNTGIGAYYDMEWMQEIGKNFDYFLKEYKSFLDEFENDIYTYNVGFEMRATYLLFKKSYHFHDASTINKLEGDVMKNFSLKFTAMKHLGVPSWDDDFDRLNELMADGIFAKDSDGNFIFNLDNYKTSEDWLEIERDYPDDLPEFERLIKSYWGYSYKCIPSTILGKYCCYDSFWTVKLRDYSDEVLKYSDKAWNIYNDNLRFGAHLNMSGFFKDVELSDEFHIKAATVIAYGRLELAKLYIRLELDDLGDTNIPEIPEVSSLLKSGINPFDVKTLLRRVQDNQYEYGVNTEMLYKLVGEECTSVILNTISGYFNKLEDRSFRSRKAFNELETYFRTRWGYHEEQGNSIFTIDEKEYVIHNTLDRVLYFYSLTDQKREVENYLSQLDVNVYKKTYTSLSGSETTVESLMDYATSIVNINSPEVIKDYTFRIYERFLQELTRLNHCQDGGEITVEELKSHPVDNYEEVLDKEYVKRLHKVAGGLIEFHSEVFATKFTEAWNIFKGDRNPIRLLYRSGLFLKEKYEDYHEYMKSIDATPLTKDGWNIVNQLMRGILDKEEIDKLLKWGCFYFCSEEASQYFYKQCMKIDIEDITLEALYKVQFCYNASRKFFKSYGSYIEGILAERDACVNQPDENLISTERWHAWSDPDTIIKDYPRFEICAKKSGMFAHCYSNIA